MSAAGWYPDPAGNPNLVRFWDGQGWTARVRPSGRPRPRRGSLIVGAAAVLVLVVAGGTGTLLTRGQQSAPDPDRVAAPIGLFTDAPAYCREGSPTHRRPYPDDGRLHGGGLATRTPAQWRPADPTRLGLASDVLIAETQGATVALGALRIGDVFDGLNESLAAVETCLRAPNPLVEGALTPAGPAYPVGVPGANTAVRRDYRLPGPTPGTANIMIVDGGAPESLALLITVAHSADPLGGEATAMALSEVRVG